MVVVLVLVAWVAAGALTAVALGRRLGARSPAVDTLALSEVQGSAPSSGRGSSGGAVSHVRPSRIDRTRSA
jgi:hypothetical protein